jgi:hypothetical protein
LVRSRDLQTEPAALDIDDQREDVVPIRGRRCRNPVAQRAREYIRLGLAATRPGRLALVDQVVAGMRVAPHPDDDRLPRCSGTGRLADRAKRE